MKSLMFMGLLGLAACDSRPLSYPLIDSILIATTQSGRDIEYRYLQPENCNDCPFVFFSHGANAAYDRYDKILVPLAKNGFHIVAPNHTDSEEHKQRDQYTQMQSLPNRLEDYASLINLYQPKEFYIAGHSYGAIIAQLAGGAKLIGEASHYEVSEKLRPKALIAISPPGPIPNYTDALGWKKVETPSLIVTGTTDVLPPIAIKWQDRLVSFSVAPVGSFALIYSDMDHYFNGAFGRENSDATNEREIAATHLVNTMTTFMTNPDGLSALQDEFVEIRIRK